MMHLMAKTRGIIILIIVTYGSTINVDDAVQPNSAISSNSENGWLAADMPDPRYSPEHCGISQSGWVGDPDGVLLDKGIGGGKR